MAQPKTKQKGALKNAPKTAFPFRIVGGGLVTAIIIAAITAGTTMSNGSTAAHLAVGNTKFDIAKTSPLPQQQSGTRAYIGLNGNFKDLKMSRIQTPNDNTPLLEANGNFSGMTLEDIKRGELESHEGRLATSR